MFLDVDGTLLTSALSLTQRTIRSLQAAYDAGLAIILTSGRPVESIAQIAVAVPGSHIAIGSNGAVVVELPSLRVIHFSELASTTARSIVGIARSVRAGICLYAPTQWFAERRETVEIEITRSGTTPIFVENLMNVPLPYVKILVIGDSTQLAQCEVQLQQADLGVEWFYTYPEYLEIMPRGISKAVACARVLAHLGVAPEDAIAIGDGANDRTMLEMMGTSVAVANADASLLRIADFITLDNDSEGVAIAVEALVLGEKTSGCLLRPGEGLRCLPE